MKVIKRAFLIIPMFILLLFASCGGTGAVEEADYQPAAGVADVTIDQTAVDVPLYADESDTQSSFTPGEVTFVHRPGMVDGVHYWGITETAEHGFTAEINPEQEKWIHRTEELLYIARREFGMIPAGSGVPRFFYPPEGFLLGDVFDRVGAGRFPAWLSAGLELFWMSEMILLEVDAAAWQREKRAQGLPGFGDAWFIPGFVAGHNLSENPSAAEVRVIAYNFVRYIYEAGTLTDLVSAYRSNVTRGEEIRASLWASFANDGEVGICASLRYERNRVRDTRHRSYNVTLSLQGLYARYYFGNELIYEPQQWVWDMVLHHVAIGEESISFVKNWLGVQYEQPWPFTVLNIHVERSGGGWYRQNTIVNYQHISAPPWAMAHEAVHAVLDAANINNNFPRALRYSAEYFEEGMCDFLARLFEVETQNERFAIEAADRWYRFVLEGDFIEPNRRMTMEDVINLENYKALWFLNNIYDPSNEERFGNRYAMLNAHATTASFLFYLYTERGNREDILRLYRNIYLAEEIYGVNMSGLVSSWRAWLRGWE